MPGDCDCLHKKIWRKKDKVHCTGNRHGGCQVIVILCIKNCALKKNSVVR